MKYTLTFAARAKINNLAASAAAKTAAAERTWVDSTLHRYNKWSSFLVVNQPSGKNFHLAVGSCDTKKGNGGNEYTITSKKKQRQT